MPEIDEAQLQNYRVVGDFVQKGLAHPEARRLIKKAERLLYPERAVPEEDAKAEVLEAFEAHRKSQDERLAAFEEREKKREEEAARANLARQWQAGQGKARSAGYTDEGLAALEKFMEERGVFDHEIAIPAFERLHPPAEPTTGGQGANWNFFEKPDDGPMKEAMSALLEEGNDEKFLNMTIPSVLKEVRGR